MYFALRYTSPKSQLLITGILILLEVIVNVMLLVSVPPRVKYVYPTRDTKLKICQGLDERSYMISLIYPFVLIGKSILDKQTNEQKKKKQRQPQQQSNYSRRIIFYIYIRLQLYAPYTPSRRENVRRVSTRPNTLPSPITRP